MFQKTNIFLFMENPNCNFCVLLRGNINGYTLRQDYVMMAEQ